MSFKVVEVRDDTEFHELARVEREAFENPDNRLLELYFPLPENANSVDEAREASIHEAAARQIAWHRSDPTSRWIKAVDDATGAVLGASLWHLHQQDPYSTPSDADDDDDDDKHGCTWFAEGEDREFANALMGQFFTPRATYMKTPHVFLNIFFTSAVARRRGVGRLMMEWGMSLANAHQLPAYIDATDLGRRLYTHYGFEAAATPREFSSAAFAVTPRLRELERRLLPFRWWPMWRPVGGVWSAGVKAPWAVVQEVKAAEVDGGDEAVEVSSVEVNPSVGRES